MSVCLSVSLSLSLSLSLSRSLSLSLFNLCESYCFGQAPSPWDSSLHTLTARSPRSPFPTSLSHQMSPGDAFPYLNYPSSISTLLSLYAFILLYRLCRKYLGHVSITPKFISLQLVIALTRIQSLIMGILASNGIPACRGALSTVILSQSK